MVISPIRILNMGYKATNAKDLQQWDWYLYVANFCYCKNLYSSIAKRMADKEEEKRMKFARVMSVYFDINTIFFLYSKWIITLERIIGTHANANETGFYLCKRQMPLKVCVTKLLCSRIRVGYLRYIWNLAIIIWNECWPTQRCKSSMISINFFRLKCANVDQHRSS